ILTEPKNALVRQYTALLSTEGVTLQFTADAIERIADVATMVNERTENIGARRLHTVMEKLLDEVSFEAPDLHDKKLTIDAAYVQSAVPSKSLTGPAPVSVDHLEVFAATIEPGAPTPPNRELLKPHFMVAKIPVQPPPDPDAEPDEAAPKDTRPKPGDTIAY